MRLNEAPPIVLIYESELEMIARCVMDFPNLETGGDFFGLWTKDGNPCVHYAIGPGEKTKRTATSFFQDIDYLKECGFLINESYGLEHVGAWHSHHHMQLPDPSQGDVNTMKKALEQTDFSRFIVSICNIEKQEVAINGFLFSYDNLHHYATCNWKILAGKSPIREQLEKEQENQLHLFTEPLSKHSSYYVKNLEIADVIVENDIVEKPEFPKNSYWNKPKGQQYLKKVFTQMNERKDLSQVEIIQLADQRVAIAFKQQGKAYELRFPDNFPKQDAEVVEKVSVNDVLQIIVRPPQKQKNIVRKFLENVNIFNKD